MRTRVWVAHPDIDFGAGRGRPVSDEFETVFGDTFLVADGTLTLTPQETDRLIPLPAPPAVRCLPENLPRLTAPAFPRTVEDIRALRNLAFAVANPVAGSRAEVQIDGQRVGDLDLSRAAGLLLQIDPQRLVRGGTITARLTAHPIRECVGRELFRQVLPGITVAPPRAICDPRPEIRARIPTPADLAAGRGPEFEVDDFIAGMTTLVLLDGQTVTTSNLRSFTLPRDVVTLLGQRGGTLSVETRVPGRPACNITKEIGKVKIAARRPLREPAFLQKFIEDFTVPTAWVAGIGQIVFGTVSAQFNGDRRLVGGQPVNVLVDGQRATTATTSAQGVFRATVTLPSGSHRIEVQAPVNGGVPFTARRSQTVVAQARLDPEIVERIQKQRRETEAAIRETEEILRRIREITPGI